ncbi:hypothetical protein T4B_13238 [Trichinella pseudospiralis]|uniref:Uncharacterized protein n=1 Tax=Trichinella pseudospiralis TaxID=6337 RepID=A0A0V1ECI0_TRIPS|nr:hypothetical protein T4A_6737 [Trichinella pseudospiralis]KRZ16069.1 hypothetical protein T4B_13238 [Trichinella pseudospiralis]KRZ41677.1 hypothetical protein T4C_1662 [Trichinella pseudospiralis]
MDASLNFATSRIKTIIQNATKMKSKTLNFSTTKVTRSRTPLNLKVLQLEEVGWTDGFENDEAATSDVKAAQEFPEQDVQRNYSSLTAKVLAMMTSNVLIINQRSLIQRVFISKNCDNRIPQQQYYQD